jgi:malonyl-CoA O-methyltransferase
MSLNFDKKIIAENFSKAAKIYDKSASVQQEAAKNLVRVALPFVENNSKILDLGSGTSFIAKEFLNHEEFQQKKVKFYEVDLSLEMLQSWKDRPSENFFAIQADIENLPFETQSFDLIISSFSLQWLENLPKIFARISSLLKPNGIFAFCVPTYESLFELRKSSLESGCDFHFNDLPKNIDLTSALAKSGFKEKFTTTEIVKQEFKNGVEALKSLKILGANHYNHHSEKRNFVTKTKLNQFNNFCLKNFSAPNKSISISWHNSYFIANL